MVDESDEVVETLCLLGGIPAVMRFGTSEWPLSIQLEAAYFLLQMCQTSPLTLQMFIAAKGWDGGMNVILPNNHNAILCFCGSCHKKDEIITFGPLISRCDTLDCPFWSSSSSPATTTLEILLAVDDDIISAI